MNKTIKRIIIGMVIVVIAFLFYMIFFDSNRYVRMEKNLIKKAKEYVLNNNISTDKEIYLDVQMINYKLDEDCSIESGVLYDGDSYKSYLLCNNYESKILDNNSNIKLLGKVIDVIPKGVPYIEEGFISDDEVVVSGEVKDSVGVYNLEYKSNLDSVIRKVIVVDNEELYSYYPKMTIKGNENVLINKNDKYIDEGAEAFDIIDGDITNKIIVNNRVNPSIVNKYTVIYKVTNSRGYTNSITRFVEVGEGENVLSTIIPKEITNSDVSIVLSIKNDTYNYTVLPNNKITKNKYIVYSVSSNGIYKFTIYDKNNNSIEKEIEVNNIDNSVPLISCIGKISPHQITFNVTNENNKTINVYNYFVNNSLVGYSSQNTYIKNIENVVKASVEVTDNVGNKNKVNCELVNEDPTTGNTNIRYYTYNGKEYVIANTKNDLTAFVNATKGIISQDADKDECIDTCLSFSLYHAVYLQRRNIQDMNLSDACHWKYNQSYYIRSHKTKKQAINTLYNEIINGRVAVLQVTGTKKRSSRHFVTVVGYLRSKYNVNEINEEDLLCIDSWTGDFVTLSYDDKEKRTMYDNNDEYGYRVDVFNRSKWK